MKKSIITLLIFLFSTIVYAQPFTNAEKLAWEKQASTIEIIKDNWGVPHIYTNTDADAVFGMMYVQCEEYFSKVEDAIISRMGRESEVQGKTAIYKDLWSRLYIDTVQAKKLYQKEFIRWFKLTAEINPVLKLFRQVEMNIPTLYIMGEEDYMFLPSVREVVKSHYKSSKLVVIENCGHVVNVEQPFSFNEEVLSFIFLQK